MTVKHKRAGRIGGAKSTPRKRDAARASAISRWKRGGFRNPAKHRAARWGSRPWAVVALPSDDGKSVDLPGGLTMVTDGRRACISDRTSAAIICVRAGLIRAHHKFTSRQAAYMRLKRLLQARGA